MSTHIRDRLPIVPPSISVLVIHGKHDRPVPYIESEHIVAGIGAHARHVTVDPSRKIPGSIPTDEFAHRFFHYLDDDTWVGVFETFLDDVPTTGVKN